MPIAKTDAVTDGKNDCDAAGNPNAPARRGSAPHDATFPTSASVDELVEHEACRMLPYSAVAAAAVLSSVKAVGILEPLVVTVDKHVLDGRYRLAAARAQGMERVPICVQDPANPNEFVFHVKDAREHLTDIDRAFLAVQYKNALKGKYVAGRTAQMNAARLATSESIAGGNLPIHPAREINAEPRSEKRDSRKEACERFKTSERKFRAVQRLSEYRPDLYEKVIAGEITAQDALKKRGKNTDDLRAAEATGMDVRDEDVIDGDMENKILVGDAADVLAHVADGAASLVLFSPPYHDVKGEEYDPPIPEQAYATYLHRMRPVLEQAYRISRTGARLAIVVDNVRNREGGEYMLPLAQDLTRLAREAGWHYLNEIAWCKDQVAGKGTNFGSLGRCSAPLLSRSHEKLPAWRCLRRRRRSTRTSRCLTSTTTRYLPRETRWPCRCSAIVSGR